MQAQFNQAQALHQAGKFQQAEVLYRQLLPFYLIFIRMTRLTSKVMPLYENTKTTRV